MPKATDTSKIEVLPDGDFDKYYPLICHDIQLLRLGSERTDFEASHLLSGIDSAGGYSRKSKVAGNKVVIEAEVYHQNVNHKHKSYSNLDGTCKKPEEIELNAKMPNQDDYVVVINESKFLSDSMPSQEYVTNSKISQLEFNFLQNYYSHCEDFDGDINVAISDKIKEAQIYLHRLGYLSHAIQVDGVYTDFVLEAVKKFQDDIAKQSTGDEIDLHVSMPTNGYLTVRTFVYLVCRYSNVHKALTRKGVDLPDVRNADKGSLALFRTSVRHFQECQSLKDCIPGYLCAKTTAKLLEALK